MDDDRSAVYDSDDFVDRLSSKCPQLLAIMDALETEKEAEDFRAELIEVVAAFDSRKSAFFNDCEQEAAKVIIQTKSGLSATIKGKNFEE